MVFVFAAVAVLVDRHVVGAAMHAASTVTVSAEHRFPDVARFVIAQDADEWSATSDMIVHGLLSLAEHRAGFGRPAFVCLDDGSEPSRAESRVALGPFNVASRTRHLRDRCCLGRIGPSEFQAAGVGSHRSLLNARHLQSGSVQTGRCQE